MIKHKWEPTTKQKRELECLGYFAMPISKYKPSDWSIISKGKKQKSIMPEVVESEEGLTPEECYFLITDKGQKSIITNNIPRLMQLIDAKSWRLRHIDLYEQGIIEGTVPYYTLLVEEKPPESVVWFLANTMFKGNDKDLILNIYKDKQ